MYPDDDLLPRTPELIYMVAHPLPFRFARNTETIVLQCRAVSTQPLQYQWERSIDSGLTWQDIANANKPKLIFNAAPRPNGGFIPHYRCRITNGQFTIYTVPSTYEIRA